MNGPPSTSVDKALPLTVIGGYLGAGKTTLVNRLLQNAGGRRIAVLVNDFGQINIDVELIESHDGSTISLANGCVCCSFADGLAMALLDIRDQADRFDHVVIEVSGVGDPWKVAQWGRTPGFTLDSVLVLVAADSFIDKANDPLVGETVRLQVANADLVLLTRSDLADPKATEQWLAAHVSAPILIGPSGDVPVEVVLGDPDSRRAVDPRAPALLGAAAGADVVEDNDAAAHHRFSSWVVHPPVLSPDELGAWLHEAPASIWRVKGLVDTTAGRRMVQMVGSRVVVLPVEAATGVPDRPETIGLVVIAERSTVAGDRWRTRFDQAP